MQTHTLVHFSLLAFLKQFLTKDTIGRTLAEAPRRHSAVSTLYQFREGTWVENLAVRSNGDLIVGFADRPEIHLSPADTGHESAELIYRFPNATSIFGITEICEDESAVSVGDFRIETLHPYRGTCSVWRVEFRRKGTRDVEDPTITDIPKATILNGLVTLDREAGTILLAESKFGQVYLLDTHSGEYRVALRGSTMRLDPRNPIIFGVNGLKIRVMEGKTYLYYTNSSKALLCRIQIDLKRGQSSRTFPCCSEVWPKFGSGRLRARHH